MSARSNKLQFITDTSPPQKFECTDICDLRVTLLPRIYREGKLIPINTWLFHPNDCITGESKVTFESWTFSSASEWYLKFISAFKMWISTPGIVVNRNNGVRLGWLLLLSLFQNFKKKKKKKSQSWKSAFFQLCVL